MDEDGLPVAAAAAGSQFFPSGASTPPAPSSAFNASDTSSGSGGPANISGDSTTATATASDDDDGEDDDNGEQGEDGDDDDDADADAGTEVTLCRAPTLACLGRACGKAGSEVSVLWEGFGCQAAAALNVSFACRIGGLEVPAVSLEGSSSSSSAGGGGLGLTGGMQGDRQEAWGPDWVGAGGGLVCKVPRLEWAEEGQEQAVMVPVEVVWFSTGQVCVCVCVCVDVVVVMFGGSVVGVSAALVLFVGRGGGWLYFTFRLCACSFTPQHKYL